MGLWPNGSRATLDLGDSFAPSPWRSNPPQCGRCQNGAGSGEGPSTNGLSYDRDGQNKKWVEGIVGGGSRRGDLPEIQDCGTGVTKAKALKQTAMGSRRGDELREKGGSR